MKIKVSELEREQLAEWTARAQGWSLCLDERIAPNWWYWIDNDDFIAYDKDYRPDINGGQAMDLVKAFPECAPQYTSHRPGAEKRWVSRFSYASERRVLMGFMVGDEPEIAICRAVVASVYGEYVEDT